MKKKIIYVITKSFWGGAQRYVFDLATNLPKESFDVLVISGGPPVGGLIEKLKTVGIKTISLPYMGRDISYLKDIGVLFQLIKIFRKEKPDIIHLNSSKIGIIGSVAGKIVGVKKIIFTAHGWAFNEDRPWLAKKIIKFITWFSLLFMDKIIAVSTAIIKDTSNLPFISKKFVLIHNGIKNFSLLNREKARQIIKGPSFSKGRSLIWIGTISELHKNKGLEYAINAVALIRHLPFIFIIIGEGELKENLKSQILNLKLEEKVFLANHLDEARRYLPAFDIFTLTSITEALGYVILEAGLAGLPVVASKVGGIPEIISHKKNGLLIEPKNEKEISLALEKLILNPDLRNKLGMNLKEDIEKKFSIEEMIKKTSMLYQ